MDKETMNNIINGLIFEPLSRNFSCGNETQTAITTYNNVNIVEYTYFPWSIFKNVNTWYVVDLILPIGTLDSLSDNYYCEEGFGVPEVKTIEEAIEIVENFKDGLLNSHYQKGTQTECTGN